MTAELAISLAAVFVSVGLVSGWLVATLVERRSPGRQRLREIEHLQKTGVVVAPSSLVDTPEGAWTRVAKVMPKSPKEMSRLRRRLVRAGFPSLTAIFVYSLAEAVVPLVFALVPIFWLGFSRGLPFAAVAGVLGYFVPGLIVERRLRLRQKAISNALPDVLDLLIVCLEAGLALDQAIVKTCEELAISHPEITEELRLLTLEMRAGKPRLEAFQNLAARTGVDDVRALVAMLSQTDRFGTSVAQALRTHADTSRTKRRQRAEERAAKIGVKLVFPLVFCLFPAFYVVTLGPAVIQFIRVFFGQVMMAH